MRKNLKVKMVNQRLDLIDKNDRDYSRWQTFR